MLLRHLLDAICANWEGYELLRTRAQREVPYYGNNDEYADEITRDVYKRQLIFSLAKRGGKVKYGVYGHSAGRTWTCAAARPTRHVF